MPEFETPYPESPAEIREDRVIVGTWSGSLTEVSREAARLRAFLAEGRSAEAREAMSGRSAEEKTALVLASLDGREELLSLTGQDGRSYSPAVVDRLPTETLVGLLAVGSDYLRFNVALLHAISPERFGRAVHDTLDPVDHPETRQKVAWEWLEAAAAVEDPARRARLLESMDTDLVEDALFSVVDRLDLGAVVGIHLPTRRFRLFSDLGIGGAPPSSYIDDPDIGLVIDALWEAAPDLFKMAIRGAWERFGGGERTEDAMDSEDEDP
jgi:hypothetical protein